MNSLWYIRNNDEHLGPYSIEELRLVGVYSDDFVWREGMSEWTRASAIKELIDLVTPVDHPFTRDDVAKGSLKNKKLPQKKSEWNHLISEAGKILSSIFKKKHSKSLL